MKNKRSYTWISQLNYHRQINSAELLICGIVAKDLSKINEGKVNWVLISRGRAVVARRPHKSKVEGSNPSPASRIKTVTANFNAYNRGL